MGHCDQLSLMNKNGRNRKSNTHYDIIQLGHCLIQNHIKHCSELGRHIVHPAEGRLRGPSVLLSNSLFFRPFSYDQQAPLFLGSLLLFRSTKIKYKLKINKINKQLG